MKLPNRTKQQSAEDRSLAIIQYKLDRLGIIRKQTENDFGIDLDLEIVREGQVTGRYVKIQVKSAASLKLRKDGTPSVGGIKQSTLQYWCEIAFRTPVMALAVDLGTEKIYATGNLFWQATRKIDGGASTKSISFLPEGPNDLAMVVFSTVYEAYAPTMNEFVSAHKMALRRLGAFLSLLVDAFHYDPGTDLDENTVKELLEVSAILLFGRGEKIWDNAQDQRNWGRFDYWRRKSENDGWHGFCCMPAQPMLSKLLPALIEVLRGTRKRVLDGQYYWAHKDPSYLEVVYESSLPDSSDVESLREWGYNYDSQIQKPPISGAYFVSMAKKATVGKPKAKKAPKD